MICQFKDTKSEQAPYRWCHVIQGYCQFRDHNSDQFCPIRYAYKDFPPKIVVLDNINIIEDVYCNIFNIEMPEEI